MQKEQDHGVAMVTILQTQHTKQTRYMIIKLKHGIVTEQEVIQQHQLALGQAIQVTFIHLVKM